MLQGVQSLCAHMSWQQDLIKWSTYGDLRVLIGPSSSVWRIWDCPCCTFGLVMLRETWDQGSTPEHILLCSQVQCSRIVGSEEQAQWVSKGFEGSTTGLPVPLSPKIT